MALTWNGHDIKSPWRSWYPEVAKAIQKILGDRPGTVVCTADLVALLYPIGETTAGQQEVRERLFRVLEAIELHKEKYGLEDYVRRGLGTPTRRRAATGAWFTKVIYPLQWQAPTPKMLCPHCGQPMKGPAHGA